MSNFHNYIIYVRDSRVFTLIIDGLSKVASWILNITLRVNMDVDFSSLIKFSLTMRLRKINMLVTSSLMKLTTRFESEVKLRKVVINAIMRQTLRNIAELKLYRVVIVGIMKTIEDLRGLTLNVAPVKFSNISIIVAEFTKLFTYDPQQLNAMDSETLQALDYTEL